MSRLSRKNKGVNTKEEPKKQEEQKENTTEVTTIEPKVVEIIPKPEEKPIEVEKFTLPEVEEEAFKSQVEDLPELKAGKNIDGSDYVEIVPVGEVVPAPEEISENITIGMDSVDDVTYGCENGIFGENTPEVEVKVIEKPFEAKLLTVKPILQRKLESLSPAELKAYQRSGILPK